MDDKTICKKPDKIWRNPVFKFWWDPIPSGKMECAWGSTFTCDKCEGDYYGVGDFCTKLCPIMNKTFESTNIFDECVKFSYERELTDLKCNPGDYEDGRFLPYGALDCFD